MDVCVRLGRRIRLLRTQRDISQEMLSSRIGMTRANLSRIENGKAEPGLRVLRDLARAFGITLAEFLEGID